MTKKVDPKVQALVDELTKKLTDQGKLIEVGWVGYKHLAMHPNCSQIQFDECRMAFFAGAHHLFGSLMSMLDPEEEPTAKDTERMNQIAAELQAFIAIFRARFKPQQ